MCLNVLGLTEWREEEPVRVQEGPAPETRLLAQRGVGCAARLPGGLGHEAVGVGRLGLEHDHLLDAARKRADYRFRRAAGLPVGVGRPTFVNYVTL